MAKKKVEEVDDEDDDLFDDDDEEIESHYPEVKPKSDSLEEPKFPDEEEETEDLEFELEPSEPEQTYKYLKLTLDKTVGKNDYSLKVEGQSHGFLNIFVKHLLNTEGVNSAAYKVTQIDPPEIFIRLEDGFEIRDVLYKGVDSLRSEVSETETAFKKLM